MDAVCTVVDGDISRQKIYADCGLSICMKYGGRRVEFVAYETLDYGGFADACVAEEDEFVFSVAERCALVDVGLLFSGFHWLFFIFLNY